jgi:hypothetical protein
MQNDLFINRVSIKFVRLIFALCLLILILGCAGVSETQAPAKGPDESALAKPPRQFSGLSPVAPQPSPSDLKPGLAVHFHRNYNSRSINALTDGYLQDKTGISGTPILQLNHQFDRGAVLFDSGRNSFLAVRMQGLIHLPGSGKYTLRALVNDGVRIYIDGQMIIDEPKYGSDRYAVPAELSITSPGWYSIKVEYFQRQGSAALKVFWSAPASETFDVIPGEVFAHTGTEFRTSSD